MLHNGCEERSGKGGGGGGRGRGGYIQGIYPRRVREEWSRWGEGGKWGEWGGGLMERG